MNNPIKKRILTIFNRIIQITQRGSDAYLTYYDYIDDIINNGEYSILQDMFLKYFKVDIRLWKNITILKQETWKIVSLNTDTTFMYRLKDYYDANNVYQIGQNIYDNTTNELLGKFTELTRAEQIIYQGITYSYYPEYQYYRNTDLYKILDEPKAIILQLQIGTLSNSPIVFLADPTMPLLDKYKAGIQLLL
jgi:hypothetical protein